MTDHRTVERAEKEGQAASLVRGTEVQLLRPVLRRAGVHGARLGYAHSLSHLSARRTTEQVMAVGKDRRLLYKHCGDASAFQAE